MSTVQEDSGRLAVLIAAPWRGEAPMHNDLNNLYAALQRRGFAPEEFLTLSGPINRTLLLSVLREAASRARHWKHAVADATPLYEADLALAPAERELTAMSAIAGADFQEL